MAKSYVKYETPKEIVSKSLEALQVANDSGRVRKGANETTKSIESGTAELVFIASDVEPEEVVMHLPSLCQEKGVCYVFIPTKKEIGEACSLPVSCAAMAIEKPANATESVKAICDKIKPMCKLTSDTKTEEKKAPAVEEKKEEKVKKEKKSTKTKKEKKTSKKDDKKKSTKTKDEKTSAKKDSKKK